MMRCFQTRLRYVAVRCVIALAGMAAANVNAEQTLFQFNDDFDPAAVAAQDVKLTRHESALRLATGHEHNWPGITLKAPEGHWDLAAFEYVAVDVKNLAAARVEVCCRVDNPGADGSNNCVTERIGLGPGEQNTLKVPLTAKMPEALREKLFGMRGYPGRWDPRRGIDAANVTQLLIFVNRPSTDHLFEIANVRAAGSRQTAIPTDPEKLFPMIDRLGQFIHKDWPGKTHSEADFAKQQQQETKDLAAHQGPGDWDQYGGWQSGPKLEATGRFRPEKHQGKWWLVDPDGRLFWSHGTDCVRPTTAYTPITDREHWFAELPGRDSPFGRFYGRSGWAPHGYYQDKPAYDTYNFTGANLLRKYGDDWQQRFADVTHRRLRSWGMNTIANWSDPEIYLMRKTPYTANVSARSKSIEGSQGYWGKFPDVFDPSFREGVRRGMAAQRGKATGDPWCIGYFVSNELSWGDELSLAVAALASPADQAAKTVFLDDLKQKYETIQRLNAAWGTNHASWDALRESQQPPDKEKARDDLADFYTKTAEQYFRVCREAIKQVDPQGLYLGCRFAWVNDRAVRAAAKFCDVVSFNRYSYSVADFRLPEGVDKPVVIGEFHFGALDRGMFHTGLRLTADQDARAKAYASYVRGALANPWIVGTHWFQYGDQATTGRGDGENYQIGLLDVCDRPYPETIRAVRRVGYGMYADRLSLPRVLLIGDSISIGYTPAVQELLKGKAWVQRIPGNAQHTGTGLEKLDQWLGDESWDVIHFNWGLWDLCYRNPDSKTQGGRDKVHGTLTTTLPQYKQNLEKLVERLQATGAKLIWAATTPVPEGEGGRIQGDAARYNAVAAEIMKARGVTINDLHAYILPRQAEFQTAPGNVHFTKEGSQYLAEKVAAAITEALER